MKSYIKPNIDFTRFYFDVMAQSSPDDALSPWNNEWNSELSQGN